MGLINKIRDFLANVFSQPPYPSPCHGDCNQGRNCDCVPTPEQQRKHQLEDEFNNSNWPFPVNKP
jgi:hypothetical protein